MTKKILVIFFVVFLILGGVVFARNTVVKIGVQQGVRIITGLNLSIDHLDIGLFKPTIAIRNLMLFNPPEFGDKLMVNLPEIYVDYDLKSILKSKYHFPEMRIHLQEFLVVKNEKGKLNLDSLKAIGSQSVPESPLQKEQKLPDIKIDQLELIIGKVVYKDYSNGEVPMIREFPINLREKYENIDNPQTLVKLIVVKALAKTTIASLANFNLNALQSNLTGTLQSATSEVTHLATETLKKTTKGLKEIIKLPLDQ